MNRLDDIEVQFKMGGKSLAGQQSNISEHDVAWLINRVKHLEKVTHISESKLQIAIEALKKVSEYKPQHSGYTSPSVNALMTIMDCGPK